MIDILPSVIEVVVVYAVFCLMQRRPMTSVGAAAVCKPPPSNHALRMVQQLLTPAALCDAAPFEYRVSNTSGEPALRRLRTIPAQSWCRQQRSRCISAESAVLLPLLRSRTLWYAGYRYSDCSQDQANR